MSTQCSFSSLTVVVPKPAARETINPRNGKQSESGRFTISVQSLDNSLLHVSGKGDGHAREEEEEEEGEEEKEKEKEKEEETRGMWKGMCEGETHSGLPGEFAEPVPTPKYEGISFEI